MEKQQPLEEFLDDFELLKIEIRMCGDLRLLPIKKVAELALLNRDASSCCQLDRITGCGGNLCHIALLPMCISCVSALYLYGFFGAKLLRMT